MVGFPRKSLGLLLFLSACLSAPLELEVGTAGGIGGDGGGGGGGLGGGFPEGGSGDGGFPAGGGPGSGGFAGFPAGGGPGFGGFAGFPAGGGPGFGGFAGFPAGGGPGFGGFAGFPAGGGPGFGGFAGFPAGGGPGFGGFAGFPAGGRPGFGGFAGFPAGGSPGFGGFPGMGGGAGNTGGTGGVIFPSMVVVSPTQVDFGELPVGSSSAKTPIRITNIGKGNAGPFRFDRSGSNEFGLDINTCNNALAPGQSCEFLVTFNVKTEGGQVGNIVLSDKLGTSVTVTLTGGKGTAQTSFAISPSSWDFGEDGTDVAVTKVFTLYNNSKVPLGRPEVRLGNPMSGFTFVSECNATLQPGGSCSVRVSFNSMGFNQTQYSTLEATTPGGGTTQAFLTGHVRTRSGMNWEILSYDFGTIPYGSQVSTTLFLRADPTTQIATFVKQVVPPPGFTLTFDRCTGFTLRPGTSCAVGVAPITTGQPGPRMERLIAYDGFGGSVSTTLSANVLFAPIGHWQFDEGGGNQLKDSSGNNNTGTAVQGLSANKPGFQTAPTWTAGRSGFALWFNGKDQWVRVEPSTILQRTGINNSVTLSAWVNLRRSNSDGALTTVVQQHQPGTRLENYFLGLRGGSLGIGIYFFYATATETFPIDRWTHVAMTYDGIQQCGFVNGRPVICQDVGWPISMDAAPLTIGGGINEDSVGDFVDGLIDEVRIYDMALPESEVRRLAQP